MKTLQASACLFVAMVLAAPMAGAGGSIRSKTHQWVHARRQTVRAWRHNKRFHRLRARWRHARGRIKRRVRLGPRLSGVRARLVQRFRGSERPLHPKSPADGRRWSGSHRGYSIYQFFLTPAAAMHAAVDGATVQAPQ